MEEIDDKKYKMLASLGYRILVSSFFVATCLLLFHRQLLSYQFWPLSIPNVLVELGGVLILFSVIGQKSLRHRAAIIVVLLFLIIMSVLHLYIVITITIPREDHIALGDKSFEQGNDAQAINEYSQAIIIDPKYAFAYFSRGCSYYRQHNYHQAVLDLSRAIKNKHRFAAAFEARGRAYDDLKLWDKATSDYSEVLSIKPDSITYQERGGDYLQQGKFTQAISDYTNGIKIDEATNPFLYQGRGRAYEMQGDLRRAILDYTKAIELMPQMGWFYWQRGHVFLRCREYDKARADFHMAEASGFRAETELKFLDSLKEVSGRDK